MLRYFKPATFLYYFEKVFRCGIFRNKKIAIILNRFDPMLF